MIVRRILGDRLTLRRQRTGTGIGFHPARVFSFNRLVEDLSVDLSARGNVLKAGFVEGEQSLFVVPSARLQKEIVTFKEGFQFGVHQEKQPGGWNQLPSRSSDFATASKIPAVAAASRRLAAPSGELGNLDQQAGPEGKA